MRPATISATATLLALAALVTLNLGGCGPEFADTDPASDQAQSKALATGESDIRLPAGTFQAFEVPAAAGQDIEVVVLPKSPAILGIGRVIAPDGHELKGYPGAETRSSDGRLRVERRPLGDGGTGLRFVGTTDTAGTWRFTILVQQPVSRAMLREALGHRTFAEAMLLWFYVLSGEPPLDQPAADLLYANFPDLAVPSAPLDVMIRVTTGNAGDFVAPDTGSDNGGSSDGASGASGSGNDQAGSDANGSDSGDNGGSSGDNAGSGNGSGSGDNSGSGDGGDNTGSGSGSSSGSNDGNGDNSGDGGGEPTDNGPPAAIAVAPIVQTGDPVPGQDGATFTYFGNPVIDDEGRVAFYAAFTGGAGTGGLYVWHDDQLERVIDDDPTQTGTVPGFEDSAHFGRFTIRWDTGSQHLAWGSGGRLLFATSVNNMPQANAVFRWRASDGDLLLVSDAELVRAAVPDSTADFIPDFYHPGLSDGGIAMFSNRYSYFRENGSFALFQRGVFTTDGRTTWQIAEPAVPGSVPEQPAFAFFQDKPVLITTNNARGEFLFQAAYASDAGNRGVYRLRDGELSRVIDNAPGRSFPGLPVGTQVGAPGTDYDAIAISRNGYIAIETTLTANEQTKETILRWDGGAWSAFHTLNDAEPTDLLSGINDGGRAIYLADGTPILGDDRTAFNLATTLPAGLVGADVTWLPFGGAINDFDRALLRFKRTDADEAGGIVFWTGQRLLMVIDSAAPAGLDAIDAIFPVEKRGPDEVDRVGTVVFRPETNRPGLSGAINNLDQFVFRAGSRGDDGSENTSDDRQAIFLGEPE